MREDSAAMLRQVKREGTAATHFAFNGNGTAVRLNYVLHDSQPQAGAAVLATARFIDAIEPLEHTWQVLRVNAAPVVAHDNANLVVKTLAADLNRLARLAVLNGIVNEVHDRLLEKVCVYIRLDSSGAIETQWYALLHRFCYFF